MYEYQCRQCGERYEELRRFEDADRDLKCPSCGAEEVERLVSAFATAGCRAPGGFS
jgi:putative FmdB family regulatory protein